MLLPRFSTITITARRLRYLTTRTFSPTNNVLSQPQGTEGSGILSNLDTYRGKQKHPHLQASYVAPGINIDKSKFFYRAIGRERGKPSKNQTMAPMSRNTKVQPSKASGGIPNPTIEYLANTNQGQIPIASPHARHLLVVIDLNGTLLYRPSRKAPTRFTARPHASKFLQYCIDTFSVIIWSSAKSENVVPMCQSILTPNLREKVVAIWGRETFGLSANDFNMRVQCYKRLTKLWNDPTIAASHPDCVNGGRWDQTNTVLIDDSSEKARSEPFNLIEIPEFFGASNEVGDVLPQVHDYLNYLSMHQNVSAAIRHQPFVTQPKVHPADVTALRMPVIPPRIQTPVQPEVEYQPTNSIDLVPNKYEPRLGNSEKW